MRSEMPFLMPANSLIFCKHPTNNPSVKAAHLKQTWSLSVTVVSLRLDTKVNNNIDKVFVDKQPGIAGMPPLVQSSAWVS